MEFSTLIWIIMLIVAPLATAMFAGAGGLIDEIGKGGLMLEEPRPAPPAPSQPLTPAGRAEREAEIRQMVQARRDRELARGEPAVEVEAEVQRLLVLGAEMEPDAAGEQDKLLREEVRQLVVARNERRMRRGEPPLDVEAEVDRQLADLT